ncbi:MAG: hypothetical protein KGQ88_07480, partial [Chloroflexi bacterium]|nr:hypothetical protein [Chloroflexota bacterium]
MERPIAAPRATPIRLRGLVSSRVVNTIVLVLVAVVGVLVIARIWHRGPGYFAQILVYGVANGSIYALIAIGYTMVYGIIELINFAHGDVFTLGGFVALALLPMFGVKEGQPTSAVILPLLITLIVSMLFCGGVNVLIERIAYRPLRHAPRLAPLITAVGMSFTLEGIMFLWRGPF